MPVTPPPLRSLSVKTSLGACRLQQSRRLSAGTFDDSRPPSRTGRAPVRPKFAEWAEESTYTPVPRLRPDPQRRKSRRGRRRTAPPAGRPLVQRAFDRRGTGSGRACVPAQAPILGGGLKKDPPGFHNGNCHRLFSDLGSAVSIQRESRHLSHVLSVTLFWDSTQIVSLYSYKVSVEGSLFGSIWFEVTIFLLRRLSCAAQPSWGHFSPRCRRKNGGCCRKLELRKKCASHCGEAHGKNPLLRGSWLDEILLRFAR